MTYSTSNPPVMILQGGVGNQFPAQWAYNSTDPASSVRVDGYFTNGKALGMKVGDIVYVTDTDASPRITTTHIVTSVNANGSVDISDTGATVGSTDTD